MNCEGLLVKNNKQGHRVLRLHYTADPDKNPSSVTGKLWFDKETNKYIGGTGSLGWRREMEIDFGAGSGELVFPEFFDMEMSLTCDPFELDETYNFFGGFDWGTRNPLSFHVYAESRDHRFFSIWEYFDEHKPIPYVARRIKECPYYERIQWIASDPSIWTENIPKKDGFASVATMLQDEEEVGDKFVIDKLTSAHDRSDVGGINKFKSMWSIVPPKFVIFKSCVNQINEFKNLKYPERKEITNETEKILDKNNHSWDDAKYFILSHPYAKTFEEKPKYGTIGYINKMSALAGDIASMTGRSVQEEFNELYGQQL